MAIDNTHTKYLKGKDKKIWENYKEALAAQNTLDSFMSGFKIDDSKFDENGEYEIPLRQNKK